MYVVYWQTIFLFSKIYKWNSKYFVTLIKLQHRRSHNIVLSIWFHRWRFFDVGIIEIIKCENCVKPRAYIFRLTNYSELLIRSTISPVETSWQWYVIYKKLKKKKIQRKHTIILTYDADETVHPNQRTNAGTQRAHCGMATDLRNARRRRPNNTPGEAAKNLPPVTRRRVAAVVMVTRLGRRTCVARRPRVIVGAEIYGRGAWSVHFILERKKKDNNKWVCVVEFGKVSRRKSRSGFGRFPSLPKHRAGTTGIPRCENNHGCDSLAGTQKSVLSRIRT